MSVFRFKDTSDFVKLGITQYKYAQQIYVTYINYNVLIYTFDGWYF